MIDERPAEGRRRVPLGLRFSLIEAISILLYVCVGVAAMKSGGMVAWLLALATIVLALAFVVSAIVARGNLRAFAIGFLVGVVGHALPLFYFGAGEFDPDVARLPYSKIVGPLWSALDPVRYVLRSTDIEVPADEIRRAWVSDPIGRSGRYELQRARDGSGVEVVERPPRADFMLAAHAFWGATLGYVLGKLGSALYRRRRVGETGEPGATSTENPAR